jgi:hypothetical protein
MTEQEYQGWYAALCDEGKVIADEKAEVVRRTMDCLTPEGAPLLRLMVVNMTMREWVDRG